MFDVDSYLSIIGYPGPREATLDTLKAVHKRHLETIAFDNTLNANRGIGIWDDVDVDIDTVFQQVVLGGRGGVCFELNGLFRRLLQELGFTVEVLSAGVRGPNGEFGPDLEHMFNRVLLDGETYLVDVGISGPSYLEPLLMTKTEQEQYGSRFRVVEFAGYHIVQHKARAGQWQTMYRFRPAARSMSEWDSPVPELVEFARQIAAANTVIRSRAFETGQLVLIGRRFLTIDDGIEQVRVLVDSGEYQAVVKEILGRESD
jgi:amide synthase